MGCGKTAVTDCLRRAAVAGLNAWEVIAPSYGGTGDIRPKTRGAWLQAAITWGRV